MCEYQVARFSSPNGQITTKVFLERNASAYGRRHMFEVRACEFGAFETFRVFVSWNNITGQLEFKRVFCDTCIGEGDSFRVELEQFTKYGEEVAFAIAWIMLYFPHAGPAVKMTTRWYHDDDTRTGIEYLRRLASHKHDRLKQTIMGIRDRAQSGATTRCSNQVRSNPFHVLCNIEA